MYIPFNHVHNIGFISTRFAGTDGVSLETEKWANVFEQQRFHCFYFAGELDRDPAQGLSGPQSPLHGTGNPEDFQHGIRIFMPTACGIEN